MKDLLLVGLFTLAGIVIMPLLSKRIAQIEGKSPEEVKRAEEETKKGMLKLFKRFA